MQPVSNTGTTTIVRAARVGMEEYTSDPASPRVVAALMQLDGVWQKHKVAPAAVY